MPPIACLVWWAPVFADSPPEPSYMVNAFMHNMCPLLCTTQSYTHTQTPCTSHGLLVCSYILILPPIEFTRAQALSLPSKQTINHGWRTATSRAPLWCLRRPARRGRGRHDRHDKKLPLWMNLESCSIRHSLKSHVVDCKLAWTFQRDQNLCNYSR